MLVNHFKIAYRQLTKNKLVSFINVMGLALGLTAVLLAYIFIQDEKTFDTFHEKSERIFRVNKKVKENNGDLSKNAETPGLMAPTMEADFPEVEIATHIAPWFDEVLVSYKDQNTFVKSWMFADSNFFQVFDFKMIKGGDPSRILSTPGQIIITTELAQTLFGQKDPIGKVVKGQNDKNFTVAGLVQPAPRQSQIQFDALVSWSSTNGQEALLNFTFLNNWLAQAVFTYVLLQETQQAISVNEKLPDFTAQYMANRKDTYTFYLQPMEEVYLHSNDLRHLRGGKYGSATFLRTFSIIALLILLIACFNYINISSAKSIQRAKEVGIKKVLGAAKKQLIGQFLVETISITFLSGLMAFGLALFLLPPLNAWFGKDIPSEAFTTLGTITFFTAVLLITSLIAGFFPGWLLTRFKPISMIRSVFNIGPHGEWPRQFLTTLQLTISIALIAGTLILHKQFNYVLSKDLGFSKDQVMVMSTPPGIENNLIAFKTELAALPGVQSISVCRATVQEGTYGSTVIPEGYTDGEMKVRMFGVDSNYIKTFGMKLSEGRFLNLASDLDPGAMVVNEAFVKQMAWEKPLEKSIRFPGSEEKYPVVGIVNDFNFNSLHEEVSPLVMYLGENISNTSVRIDPAQLSTLLPQIKELWQKFESRFPFDYYFLDDYFAEKYIAEQQMLNIITLFAFLAIFIACLGLYGLAAFAIARRTKEIGIRKVLGASVISILQVLSSRFVILVFFAFALATPLVYYFSQDWLNEFAYHISLSWGVFVLAGVIVLSIVLLTISFQSTKAALTNPVNALKTE